MKPDQKSTYQETFETWNKVADLYEEKFMDLELYNDTYDTFCELLNDSAKILEIGSGPGNIAKHLLSKKPKFTILGIDIAPNMVQLANENNPSANFKVMDSRDINQLTDKFDGIISGFCLPYLSTSDCSVLIKNCNTLLNKKGVVYLSFVEGDAEHSGYQTGKNGDRVYFYYHSLSSLRKILIENGFNHIDVIKKSYPKKENESEIHTIVIAEKMI